MNWLRQLINYAVSLAVIIALVTIVPRFVRLGVDPGYTDIENLEVGRSYNADRGFSFNGLSGGDAIAYRIGGTEINGLCLGWVGGVPGDIVSIANGKILVNGKQAAKGGIMQGRVSRDRGPVPVPAGHVFVLTSFHQFDSLAYGFIPASAIAGKLGALP